MLFQSFILVIFLFLKKIYVIFVVVFSCLLYSLYVPRGLDALSGKNKSANAPSLPMDAVVLSLQDLIFYFRPPEEELEHEDKQFKLRSLKNRQNLFQEEVSLDNENSLFMRTAEFWMNILFDRFNFWSVLLFQFLFL